MQFIASLLNKLILLFQNKKQILQFVTIFISKWYIFKALNMSSVKTQSENPN